MCQICMEVATGAGLLLTLLNLVGFGIYWKRIKEAFKRKKCKTESCNCDCHPGEQK